MRFKWILAIVAIGVMAGVVTADQIELTGVVRDFKRGDWSDGHPDFQTAGSMGRFGHVTGMVTMDLGDDGRPVYNTDRPNKDTIQSASTLAQWYDDVPGVNVSMPLTLTFDNGQDSPGGLYTFSSNSFFPIDDQLLGNQGLSHNYHFTFMLSTRFSYTPGQFFTFVGDDDVWVYVNKKLVIDLGGVHSAVDGSVLLLDGKAFIERSDFDLGGDVLAVTSSMEDDLAAKWEALGLPGNCPIDEGDRYIDLDINEGGPDVRAEFDGTDVRVWATAPLANVVIQFEDGTLQRFENLSASSGTFRGTGEYEGKVVAEAWIQAGEFEGDEALAMGQHFTPEGNDRNCDLNFFFAERHTTQSNFRIDTTMDLESLDDLQISPLYD